jgi:hypothetical protein
MPAHYFVIEDLGAFLSNLVARRYQRTTSDSWEIYSKTLSKALVKFYAYPVDAVQDSPVQIRVTYKLLNDGRPLQKLVRNLKDLNYSYRQTFSDWKTKRPARKNVQEKRWENVQKFLHRHGELIGCFKYEADDRLTEGNYSFNLQVASTPKEQRICLEFIKALAEAHTPHGLTRGRRVADKPVQQRNGWIKRYAMIHKKRGWGPLEIARDIQKQLRNGTWNERSRLQYNIANNTICKIAGIKISPTNLN